MPTGGGSAAIAARAKGARTLHTIVKHEHEKHALDRRVEESIHHASMGHAKLDKPTLYERAGERLGKMLYNG